MTRTIKLTKKDDIASVIRQIKKLKDQEVIFELEQGSKLLESSANLKLIKRTGETMGKKVLVTTTDPVGRFLAMKAEVLADASEQDFRNLRPKRMTRPAGPKIFSDMRASAPKVLPMQTIQALKHRTFSRPRLKWIAAGCAAVLAVVILGGIFLPVAHVTIYARSEPIQRDLDLIVGQTVSAVDQKILAIPGRGLNREVSATQSFETTGTSLAGSKAAGRVIIHNGTVNTLTLRAATTVLLADGKKYFFVNDVSGIRPLGAANEPVEIVAELPGEDGNLGSNVRLEIQNSALGNRPEVYAETAGAVGGGSATATKVLAQADLDSALQRLVDGLIDNLQKDLEAEVPGSRLLPSGIETEVLAHTANKNIGEAANEFDMTVIARIRGLVFNEQDVSALLDGQINSILADDKYLVDGGEKSLGTAFKQVDLAAGRGTLAVHYGAIVAYKINTANLEKILAGKQAGEIREILLSKPEVDRVDVTLWPFFVRQAPRLNGKIYINTVLSPS